jgi:hypothetical protein
VLIDGDGTRSLSGLSGPTIIQRQAGTTVPDHHIDTEMRALNLSGGGITLRAGSNFGLPPSLGRITERPTNPAIGHSYFDIFFEISGPFGTLHNNNPVDNVPDAQPCRMTADIFEVPPTGSSYLGCYDAFLSDPLNDRPPGFINIDLYDANGIHRAVLLSGTGIVHTVGGNIPPLPEPPTLILLGAGLLALAMRRLSLNA